MPSWKKVIISGSDASLNSLNISTALTASGLIYPTVDGTVGQVITTDGAGNLSFLNVDNTRISIKNVSGGEIAKGTPLFITGSGTAGNIAGVIPADAGNPSLMPAGVIAGETLADGAEGVGLINGYISGVNTSLFAPGDEVFVAVGGGYTNIAPTGSALIQKLGNVEKSHPSNGSGVINGPGAARSVPNILPGYSWVGNSDYVATPVPTASFYVTSGSHALNADNATSASYASNANLLDGLNSSQFLRNDQSGTLTGDLTVTGIITAQEFHTELVSSSIIYESGSTKFGDSTDDNHQFTGSVNITGSITLIGNQFITGSVRLDSGNAVYFGPNNTYISDGAEGSLMLNDSSGYIQLDAQGPSEYSQIILNANNQEFLFVSDTNSGATLQFTKSGSLLLNGAEYDAHLATTSSLNSVSSSLATAISNIIDGTTTVTSGSYAVTASYIDPTFISASAAASGFGGGGAGSSFPFTGDAVITGSLLVSGSFIDFTQATVISGSIFSGSFVGDGSGLSGLGYGDTKKLNQTVAATTWSFSHNMNEQYPTVTVYNSNNEVIQPSKIEGVNAQTLKLYFSVPVAGTAVAVVGGVATTQEAGFNRVFTQTSTATTWSFEHNLGNKYPQIAVYDSNDELIIPGKVEAIDQNNAILYFDTPLAGTATATVGGTSLTASYAEALSINNTALSTQQNTDVDTGTETVATVSTLIHTGAFFDYVLNDGTNFRAGTVMAVWDGSSVQYNDNSTTDIGDTSGVVLSVDISGTDARLRATVATDNWTIKAFVRSL